MKPAKCKECGKEYEKKTLAHVVCCYSPCGVLYVAKQYDKKRKKEWAKEKKELKEKIKTHSDYLNELQKEVNTFVRLRDKYDNCISCLNPLKGTFHAGHYYSVGSSPSIRFDLDNIHGQCEHCNLYLHGNCAEYAINLPNKIGLLKFEALKQKRNEVNKMTIQEIKEQIEYYRIKNKLIK